MSHAAPSALIIDQGQRVLLRLAGKIYQLGQPELRSLLGLPTGEAGLGISIDGNRFRFEFTGDNQTIEISANQLLRRLAKQAAAATQKSLS